MQPKNAVSIILTVRTNLSQTMAQNSNSKLFSTKYTNFSKLHLAVHKSQIELIIVTSLTSGS